MENEKNLAILIDADNISVKYIKSILDEVSNYGIPTYKRIYGDWTATTMSSWKNVLLEHSITPIQQYSYTVGKNATDSALIIDAMDILYSNHVDGFCIVSSDSDFTKLASRLRESGMLVMGMGEKKTPKPFVSACETFRYLENLSSLPDSSAREERGERVPKNLQTNDMEQFIQSVREILHDISNEDGWASLSSVGIALIKRQPDFDTRNYGYPKLLPLITATNRFEIQKKTSADVHVNHYFIKNQ